MQPDRSPDRKEETVVIAPASGPRPREAGVIRPGASNRSNESLRAALTSPGGRTDAIRITPLEQASRMPALPTSRPQRERRRTGPLNPVYLFLVTAVPLAILAVMVWAAAQQYASLDRPAPGALVEITPASDLAQKITVVPGSLKNTRDGDKVYINGQVQNNTGGTVTGVYLKAFLYRPAPQGGQQLVGSGVGNAPGDVAPGATAPFTVTAQLLGGPVPSKPGTPPAAPKDFQTMSVQVDQVAVPTAVPSK